MASDSSPKPASRSSLALKAKMPLLLPKAVEEGWSARRLAKEAGCSPSTASKYYSEYSAKIGQSEQEAMESLPERLKEEALACTRSTASRLRAHRDHLDRLIEQMESEAELDARTVAAVLQAEERLTNLYRRVTGIDLAERQAIAKAGKTDINLQWRGTESLNLDDVIDLD